MPSANALTTVQKLYIAYYGRAADAPGQNYWAGELDKAGGSLNGIIDAFSNAQEAKALYGSGTTVNERIAVLYQNILGRAPEANGLAYWAGEVTAGRLSLGNAALAILNGVSPASTDGSLVNNRLAVAHSFTAQVSSTPQNYAGAAAAAIARTFLKQVTGDAASLLQATNQQSAYLNTLGVATRHPEKFGPLISNGLLTSTAIVSPTLTEDNMEAAVQALAPTATGAEDAAGIGITLSGSEVNGSVASFVIKSLPVNGTLMMGEQALSVGSAVEASHSAAALTFVPTANFNGAASFAFAARNSAGLEDATPATATITVKPVNDAPVGVADILAATQNKAVIYAAAQLLGNDTDVDGDAVTLKSVTAGTGGTVVLNANGTVTFTPTADFNGQAAFTYVATDGKGGDSAATSVTVNVGAIDSAPRAPWTLLMTTGVYANSKILVSDGSAAGTDVKAMSGLSGYNAAKWVVNSDKTGAYFFNDSSAMDMVGYTDGTLAGTQLIVTNQHIPSNFVTLVNDQLILAGAAPDRISGKAYVINGVQKKFTSTDMDFAVPSAYGIHDASNQVLWFAGSSSPYGRELVRFDYSNLNQMSSTIVKDIAPGVRSGLTSSNLPDFAALLNGKLIFAANDGPNAEEAWVSDGTEAGTLMLKNYGQGMSGNVGSFKPFGDKVAFSAFASNLVSNGAVLHVGTELAFTDGTSAGTTVLDINPGAANSNPRILGEANGLLYFTADARDQTSGVTQKGIYSTSGTTFTKLAPISNTATVFGWGNNKAFLKASDTQNGTELWALDFGKNTFSLVKDLLPGSAGGLGDTNIDSVQMASGKLIFKAYTSATKQGIFVSDGTAAGTVNVGAWTNIHSKVVGDTLVFSNAEGIFAVNLGAAIPAPVQLGTVGIPNLYGQPDPSALQTDADQAFYLTGSGDLFASKGETIPTAPFVSQVKQFKVVAENALFIQTTNTATNTQSLWYSDGTAAGTRFIEDLPSGDFDFQNAVAIKTVGVVA